MTRIKQARTRKAGYRGSLNTQDFPRRVYTPAERRANMLHFARMYGEMTRIWGTDTKLQRVAVAAVERVILEASA